MESIDPATVKYKTNYITRVILRIDFSPILALRDDLDPEFQDVARRKMPEFSVQSAQEFTAQFNRTGSSQSTTALNQYVFSTKNKHRKLTIGYPFLIVEVRDYHDFDDFMHLVDHIIPPFQRTYEPIAVNRLGLRYVNEIVRSKGSPYDWHGIISEDLTSLLSTPFADENHTARIMSQIVYNYGDYRTNFTFGISNSEFPSRITRREFVLDFDTYTKEAELSDYRKLLTDFNAAMVTLFEHSIGDQLRDEMRGGEH